MKSQTILKHKGFTLIEILVAITIITIIAGLGLFFDFDSFRGHSFHSDRDVLISLLQHARGEAISNICRGSCTDGKPHGVYVDVDKNQFVMFQGKHYASRDEDFDTIMSANTTITHGGVKEIVFAQLSGDASSPDTSSDCTISVPMCIKLTDNTNNRTSTITINSEGQIVWTN